VSIDTPGGGSAVVTEASLLSPEGSQDGAAVEPRLTLLQYVSVRRIRLSPPELCRAGQILADRCRAAGIELPKARERGFPRGTNLYPRSLLANWEEKRQAWEAEWHQAMVARRSAHNYQ
jgi:hypothetical protein